MRSTPTKLILSIGRKFAMPSLLLVVVAGLLLILTQGSIFSKDAFPYLSPDFWLTGFLIEQTQTAGWFASHTYDFGYPYGFSGADFPMADLFNILVIKFFAIFSNDWLSIYKACYLFTFVSVPLLTYYCLRLWGLKRVFAILVAILYTFVPYHFFRTGHLFLISYHAIPLFLISCNFIADGPMWLRIRNPALRWCMFISLQMVIASSGVYYAFFSCYLYLIFGWLLYIIRRQWKIFGRVVVALILIAGTALLQTLPGRLQSRTQGANFSVPARNFAETEISGLKLTQLFLPTMQHRNSLLRKIEQRYATGAPLVNENRTSALGVLGVIGLTASLLFIFGTVASSCISNRRKAYTELASVSSSELDHAPSGELLPLVFFSTFNLACILYATVGGFGALFSYLVMPEIRGTNRISIFMALFSLAFLFFCLQHFIKKLSRVRRTLVIVAAFACSFLGIWDQTPILNLAEGKETIESDKLFFSKISEMLPAGSPIFVLPYHPFPEGGQLSKLGDYELIKCALYAPQLRWSMPTFRGRDGDIWHRYMTSISRDRMLEEIKGMGFVGIYLEGNGCADGGDEIKRDLNELLGAPALYDETSNRSLYVWQSTKAPEDRSSFGAKFTEVASIDTPLENKFNLNIDMYQDMSAPEVLKLRQGDRLTLAGWLGSNGLASRDHIQILFVSKNASYKVDVLSGLRRNDVQSVVGTTDPYAGFMLYAYSSNLERGQYEIYVQYRTDEGALVRSDCSRKILVY